MNNQIQPQRPQRPSYSDESIPDHHPLPLPPPPPPPPSYTTVGTGPPTPTKAPVRVSSRTLNRRPSNLVVQLASPIFPPSSSPITSPLKSQYEVLSPVSAHSTGTSPFSAGHPRSYASSSSDGLTSPNRAEVPRLPPGAAPSSFSKYQGLGIGAPNQNSHRWEASQSTYGKGTGNEEAGRYGSPPGEYQRAVSEAVVQGNGHTMPVVLGIEGGRRRSGSQSRVERNGIDPVLLEPPSIPRLPPSPSLDMAYFSGQPNPQPRSDSQSNNLTAPPPAYFDQAPSQIPSSGLNDKMVRLAAASGIDLSSVSTSSIRNSSDGTRETMDDDSFDRRTGGTAVTSMSSIASSRGEKREVQHDVSVPAMQKNPSTPELLRPTMVPFRQGSRPASPARSIPPSPLGYDASLLPPRAMKSRSVSSSVVSSASSNASSGSERGSARMDVIATSRAKEQKYGGKRHLPIPPEMKGDDRARQYSQPRSVSTGAMNRQSEQRSVDYGVSNGPRQPSPLSLGTFQDPRKAPTPPNETTKVSHKDLPPIQTPNSAIFNPIHAPPQQFLSNANGRSSPVERRLNGSPLAAKPLRSASLGISASGGPTPRGVHSPPPSAPGPQTISPAYSSSAHEVMPTSAAVESIIEEMLHSSIEDGEAPQSSRRDDGPQRRPESSMSNRSEMGGGMMDRPRPSKKSSEYTIRPTAGTRSPTPQQGGFQSFRQVSAASSHYPPSYGSFKHGKASIGTIMMDETIQQSLLPFMSIASFLALLGALPAEVRRTISGEIVGRWVCREWSVAVDQRETWPGLQVWEGFLESLLHDPSAFPTYPAHFRPLLQHLSLSHTLIVLFLRSLPADAFPGSPPFAWEDDGTSVSIGLPNSQSAMTISTMAARSRTGSAVEVGSASAPRQERLFELIMPEPLSATKPEVDEVEVIIPPPPPDIRKRRGSLGSASIVSWSKGRRNSTSTTVSLQNKQSPVFVPPSGNRKAPLPPVSFPKPKRYVFRSHPDTESSYASPRSRTSSESGRPGSVFSVDDTLSLSGGPGMPPFSRSMYRHRKAPSESGSSGVGRSSLGSRHSPSMASHLRAGGGGGWSGSRTATSSPTASRFFRNDLVAPPEPVEPAFDKPLPIAVGRAPILRVFIPLSEQVRSWPSAEGARLARAELERAGAWSKLVVGDVIVNTALEDPLLPRHLMLYSPVIQPFLVPLEYRYSEHGHLPGYINAFDLPPSYYFPILPLPHIIHVDLSPWADRILPTLRLAFDRRDITTARGDKMVAKRYLHVAGFQLTPGDHRFVCEDWEGMITLEADGTAEGRREILRRIGRTSDMQVVRPVRGPWEIIREKSLGGSVWLKLIQETTTDGR